MMTVKKSTTTQAKRGKVSGQATVAKAPDAEAESKAQATTPAKPKAESKPAKGDEALTKAYARGRQASIEGTPTPKFSSEAERKAWHAGYKTHANPNSVTPVAGQEEGEHYIGPYGATEGGNNGR